MEKVGVKHAAGAPKPAHQVIQSSSLNKLVVRKYEHWNKDGNSNFSVASEFIFPHPDQNIILLKKQNNEYIL